MSELVPIRVNVPEHGIDIELYGDFGALGFAPALACAVVGAVVGSFAGGKMGLAVGALAGAGIGYAARGALLSAALRAQLLPYPEVFNEHGDAARMFFGDDGIPYSVTW